MQLPVLWLVSVSKVADKPKGIGFLETLPSLFKYNLNNTRKPKNKNKKEGGIVELLTPILNKIIRNQGTYFFVIMNSRCKIVSVHGAPL